MRPRGSKGEPLTASKDLKETRISQHRRLFWRPRSLSEEEEDWDEEEDEDWEEDEWSDEDRSGQQRF